MRAVKWHLFGACFRSRCRGCQKWFPWALRLASCWCTKKCIQCRKRHPKLLLEPLYHHGSDALISPKSVALRSSDLFITISAHGGCWVLWDLHILPSRESMPLCSKGVIVLHDIVCLRVACTIQETLGSMSWKALDHHPQSPDPPPWAFHVFNHLRMC
jgi:hypothetical protein